jgi:hypothetical protein
MQLVWFEFAAGAAPVVNNFYTIRVNAWDFIPHGEVIGARNVKGITAVSGACGDLETGEDGNQPSYPRHRRQPPGNGGPDSRRNRQRQSQHKRDDLLGRELPLHQVHGRLEALCVDGLVGTSPGATVEGEFSPPWPALRDLAREGSSIHL